MLVFKPYISISLNEQEKEVLINRPLTDGNIGNVFDLTEIGLEVIKRIGKYNEEEIINEVTKKLPNSTNEIKEIIQFLYSENYIETTETSKQNEDLNLYRRIVPLWAELETEKVTRFEIQSRINSSRVGIVGCGTLGTSIVAQLTAMGVKDFVLVDTDHIEETNLTRQPIFSLKDIGKKKTEVLKQYIMDRNASGLIEIHEKFISEMEDLQIFKNVDLIISCADEGNIDSLVNHYAIENNKIACFAGAYTGLNCRVFPIYIPGKSHSLDCIYNYLKKDIKFKGESINNSEYKVSTVPYISEFISSIATAEIIKVLTGQIDPYLINKLLFFNSAEYKIEFLEIPTKFEDCTCTQLVQV